MNVLLRCIQSNSEERHNSKELSLSTIARGLEFLKKHSALGEQIFGVVKVSRLSSARPKIVHPLSNEFNRVTNLPEDVLIMAVFSPLWAVQWAARNTAAYEGPDAISDYLEDFVQSAINNGQQIWEAQPNFIVAEVRDEFVGHAALGDVQPFSGDLQRYLWQPLAVPSPDPNVRDTQREQFFERYMQLDMDASARTLKGQQLEDALVSQGIWCSAAESDRFAAACNVRIPAPGSILSDEMNSSDRFMIPPAGSSDSDEAFSYLMMPV